MKRGVIIAALLLATGATHAQTLQNDAYKTVREIAYRGTTGDPYADSACRMDVSYPQGITGYPTVVWFHGGGLTSGRREMPLALRNQGMAVVGVGYRFSPRVRVADCIDDAAAAVAWVYRHIAELGGSPSKIYLAGHSAGAYLVSMIGLDSQYLARYGVVADSIAALIPYSGNAITHLASRAERGIPPTQPLIDSMAPLYHVRPDTPPILILSGDRTLEMYGRYEENAYLWRMFQVVGNPDVQIRELDGFDHGTMVDPGHLLLLRYIREREAARQTGSTPPPPATEQ